MRLKLFALSGAALLAWIVPLTALDKKIGWHKGLQGIALLSALACAIEAARTASSLVENTRYQEAKNLVVIQDLQHELATEGFISESERTLKAQHYLESLASAIAPPSTEDQHPVAPAPEEDSSDSAPLAPDWKIADPLVEPSTEVRGAIVRCYRAGWSMEKSIEAVYGVKKGSNGKYQAARSWYLKITKEVS